MRWSRLPAALRVAPRGAAWLLKLPVSPASAGLATGVLVAAAAFAVIGLFSRTSAAVATLAAVYVLGVPQLSGSVFHTHHLVWFGALLAASPCGDALSVDAWLAARRGRAPPPPSVAYGFPLRVAWLLVGIVFFFPGLWKWRTAGLAWAFSDNLRNQLWWKWAEQGWRPWIRVDRWPALLHAGALGVMLFEPAFGLAVFVPRLRRWAVAVAFAFHLLTDALMRIAFPALWLCYVVFFDWGWLEAALAQRGGAPAVPTAPAPRRRPWPAVAVGGLLVAGAASFGWLGIEAGWPFACYPTFRSPAPTEIPSLGIEAADGTGRPVAVRLPSMDGPAGQRRWGFVWSLAGPVPAGDPRARLAAYWEDLERGDPSLERAATVRFYRDWRSVNPDDRGRPPVRRTLLFELRPGAPAGG